jgi:hypothetical protein
VFFGILMLHFISIFMSVLNIDCFRGYRFGVMKGFGIDFFDVR